VFERRHTVQVIENKAAGYDGGEAGNSVHFFKTPTVSSPVHTKAVEALKALKALQEDAKRRGLDKMNTDEINGEIAAYRREKRLRRKSGQKTR